MQHTLSKFIVIIAVAFLPQAGSAEMKWTCKNGKISVINKGAESTEPLEYCYNTDKTALVSKGCSRGLCWATRINRLYSFDELMSPAGKPGFRLCNLLRGHPELLSFSADNKMFKLDRCLFDDGSFVDTDSLLAKALGR